MPKIYPSVLLLVSIVWLAVFSNQVVVSDIPAILDDGEGYTPRRATTNGPLVRLMLVVSPTCEYSSDPTLPTIIEELKLLTEEHAVAANYGFEAVAVATSSRTEDIGVEFLQAFGRFDSIESSARWGESVILSNALKGGLGLRATPQVLILVRRPAIQASNKSEEVLITRLIGNGSIEEWLNRGAPLALLEER